MDLYSVVCVRDRAASQKWFEAFFGRQADEVIGEEYLWQVGENAWVVIDDRYMRAARVGGTMITLGVTTSTTSWPGWPRTVSSMSLWKPTATACATWKSSTRTATACRSRRCPPGNPSPATPPRRQQHREPTATTCTGRKPNSSLADPMSACRADHHFPRVFRTIDSDQRYSTTGRD